MQEVKGRFHIHGDDGVPLGLCHAHHQTVLGNAGVVYQNIYAAEFLFNLGHNGLRLFEVGGIGGIGLHLVAEGGNLLHRFLGGFVNHKVGEGDIGPFRGKLKRNGLTDSACCARNERYFSV